MFCKVPEIKSVIKSRWRLYIINLKTFDTHRVELYKLFQLVMFWTTYVLSSSWPWPWPRSPSWPNLSLANLVTNLNKLSLDLDKPGPGKDTKFRWSTKPPTHHTTHQNFFRHFHRSKWVLFYTAFDTIYLNYGTSKNNLDLIVPDVWKNNSSNFQSKTWNLQIIPYFLF